MTKYNSEDLHAQYKNIQQLTYNYWLIINHQFVSSQVCMLCVYVMYQYREHQGRYGTQQHIEVATEAHHSKDGHDDGEDEVMITDRATWCINSHLWNSWLLLDNHYIGTRL